LLRRLDLPSILIHFQTEPLSEIRMFYTKQYPSCVSSSVEISSAQQHVEGAAGSGFPFLSRQSSNSLVFEEDGNGEAFFYLLVKRHRWQTDAECKNINEAILTTFRDVDWLVRR